MVSASKYMQIEMSHPCIYSDSDSHLSKDVLN